jgi:hypothetical protein
MFLIGLGAIVVWQLYNCFVAQAFIALPGHH